MRTGRILCWTMLMMVLAAGPAAAAPSGSVSGVQFRSLDEVVVATFTATSDAPDSFWYPAAWQQPLDAGPCSSTWRNHIVYVGNGGDGPATTIDSDYFYPDDDFPEGGRICLSVSVDGEEYVVAESAWAVPAKPKPKSLPTLTMAKARTYVRVALQRRFKSAYRNGYAKRVAGCRRLSKTKVRCGRVSWASGDVSYSGNVMVRYSRAAGRRVWRYAYTIRRTNEYCQVTSGRNCSEVLRRR